MYIEKKGSIQTIVEEFFENNAGYYPMFCSRKSENGLQKSIYEYLLYNPISEEIKMVYALLYYIYFSSLKVKEKMCLISINAEQIEKAGLIDAYENIFRQIVKKIKKEKFLKKNIIPLMSCKVVRLNVINGYICGHRYAEINKISGKTFTENGF